MPKQHTHTHTWLEEATTCRAHPGANTPGKGRHTPHRHARAQRRAPLSDCDTVSVRDISTISQILVADAAGAQLGVITAEGLDQVAALPVAELELEALTLSVPTGRKAV